MQLPDNVKAIRARYVAQRPVPQGAPGDAFEEEARQWSIAFAEQVAFELNNPLWGMKRADANRPISKDTIAFYADDDGVIRIWDLLTGTGTGSPRLNENPESEDITGQVFVPVTPTNHLGAVTPPTLPPLPPADLGPVMAYLSKLGDKIDMTHGHIEAVNTSVRSMGDLVNALIQQQQQVIDRLTALETREIHVTFPDGELRVNGRVVAKLDFPN